MNIVQIIEKKKLGFELSKEEIYFFISNYMKDKIEDYQVSALLMAICLKGMTDDEIVFLTSAMVESGDLIKLDKINKTTIDKHSTGGVGDKTSLIVGPILACFDLAVAKMSGRGLGFTGGTIDKLESLKGFTVELSEEEFINQINNINIAIIGQTKDLVPADKRLYALRDVTGTIDSIGLISASIMSKKIASGAKNIILDVKYGSGAFMKDIEQATILAKKLVMIGEAMNRNTIALVSSMQEPLGHVIGNSNEVLEAIDTLNGNGPKDVERLCFEICSEMLLLTGKVKTKEVALELIKAKIESKEAITKFKEFILAQHATTDAIDLLKKAKNIKIIKAEEKGYIKKIDALQVGESAMLLGAGRMKKTDTINMDVGIKVLKKVGSKIEVGDELFEINYDDETNLESVVRLLKGCTEISSKEIKKTNLIEAIIKKENL